MTYGEARAFIDDTARYGVVLGLDTMTELLARLGNPQDSLKFVHIAGTNGKGSTLAYISTILKEAGFRVGRYISPTLFDYRERIQVNEVFITKAGVARLAGLIKEVSAQMAEEGFSHPTTFEVETAMAFLWFRQMQCDIVVLECGMGGLTDATNGVKTTLVSVFSEIGLDHMKFLGDTIGEIARVKAGIIKQKTVAVSVQQRQEAMEVIEEVCRKKQVRLLRVKREEIRDVRLRFENQSFTYKGMKGLKPGLAGNWQVENAALAVETVLALGELGFPVAEEQIRKGLSGTIWPGRFQVIDRRPLFVVDGAHNQDAADRLYETLELYFPDKRKIFIAGVLADKEYDYVMSRLAPLAARVITIMTPGNPRALSAERLAGEIKRYNRYVEAADSLHDAVHRAREYAGEEDLILAFGSLSYLGELIREVRMGK